MRCEVCGHRIIGTPYKAIIEGARMLVCEECAKLGSISWEAQPPPSPTRKPIKPVKPPPKIYAKKQPAPTPSESLELVDGFSSRIRQAREKLGLTHEDLGRKIGEKVSLLRKIETGKMTPNHKLAEKLGHMLKIKLLAPPVVPKAPPSLPPPHGVTLGEIASLKKAKEEETEKRKPS